jgi:hypothetical protein
MNMSFFRIYHYRKVPWIWSFISSFFTSISIIPSIPEIGFIKQVECGSSIDRFLVVPHGNISTHGPLLVGGEPQIDYFMNSIFMFDEYVVSLEAKTSCKHANKHCWKRQHFARLMLKRRKKNTCLRS